MRIPPDIPVATDGELLVWTDGACRRNPGPGGWAALIVGHDVRELSGGLPHTTNNVMEMTAALEGLRALPDGSRACVVTDSRYLHDGMTAWVAAWRRKGWRTSAGQPVKNRDVWLALESEVARHLAVRWHWVRGHAGTALNERADALAVAAAAVY
jgi:ribonuclease HI